jgi:hypothetical protein
LSKADSLQSKGNLFKKFISPDYNALQKLILCKVKKIYSKNFFPDYKALSKSDLCEVKKLFQKIFFAKSGIVNLLL